MLSFRAVFITLALCLLSANAQNLISDFGCEGAMTGWVFSRITCGTIDTTGPYEGVKHFRADNAKVATASIVVQLDAAQRAVINAAPDNNLMEFQLATYVRSGLNPTPIDSVEFFMRLRDTAGVQTDITSASPYNASVWTRYSQTIKAKKGTGSVEAVFTLRRIAGTDASTEPNMAAFDAVSLSLATSNTGLAAVDTPTTASACLTCPMNCRRIAGEIFIGTSAALDPATCGRVAVGDTCCKDLQGNGFGCPKNSQCCADFCCAPNTYCHTCDNNVYRCLRTDAPYRLIQPST